MSELYWGMILQSEVLNFLHSLCNSPPHCHEAPSETWKQCIHNEDAATKFHSIKIQHARKRSHWNEKGLIMPNQITLPHEVHSLQPESFKWNTSQKIDWS